MPPVSVELKKQVKAANDIVDVVGSYLPVTTAGGGKLFKALCPFHNDTRPSLQIDRQYQNFRCWACDTKGDVFDFVMKVDKVDFPEALRSLAERAGIKLEADADDPAAQTRARLLHAVRWAEEKYHGCYLDDPLAEAARTYLGKRKLAGKTVQQFGLGYAPLLGDWLVRLAEDDRVPADVLVEVGLIAARDEGRGYYDRFRDRVMFPIRDVRGRTVGFGGRVLPESPLAARGPKYYNSAETPLFSKSDLLYGLDLARHPGSAAGCLAVVEGYTDVMMAHQCGVANVVATMGTALNARHVAQLRRYAPKVVLVFDADAGGLTGVDRALELFISQDADLAIATLPDGLDPCDLLTRPGGSDVFREALAKAKNVLDFKIDQLAAKDPDAGIDSTKRLIDSVLGIVALSPNILHPATRHLPSLPLTYKQELVLTRLSQRTQFDLERLRGRLKQLVINRIASQRESTESQPTSRSASGAATVPAGTPKASVPPPLERQLIELLLAEPVLIPQAQAAIGPADLTHDSLRLMLTGLYDLHDRGTSPDLDGLRVWLLEKGREDLARKALDLQFTGRQMTERPDWLKRVLAAFVRNQAEAESKALKAQLAAGADDEQAVDILRRLQARPSNN